jgi:hypothetical protein
MAPDSGSGKLPSDRPRAEEQVVDHSDVQSGQHFGQKVNDASLCNHEGWYWSPDSMNVGQIPNSVWCSRPKGHPGPHQARSGRAWLHPSKVKVVQWND